MHICLNLCAHTQCGIYVITNDTCMYPHVYIHDYLHFYAYIYICVCVYIDRYIQVYTYIHSERAPCPPTPSRACFRPCLRTRPSHATRGGSTSPAGLAAECPASHRRTRPTSLSDAAASRIVRLSPGFVFFYHSFCFSCTDDPVGNSKKPREKGKRYYWAT